MYICHSFVNRFAIELGGFECFGMCISSVVIRVCTTVLLVTVILYYNYCTHNYYYVIFYTVFSLHFLAM